MVPCSGMLMGARSMPFRGIEKIQKYADFF